MGLLLSAGACVPADLPPAEAGPFYEGTPAITALTWGCDPDESLWSFALKTEHWTGGGNIWLTRDHTRVESHRIYSDEAAANGAWDKLLLELDVATSWDEASAGSSTGWRCVEEEDLSYLLVVYGPRGQNVADCRLWGADAAGFAEDTGVPACETWLETEDTGS